MQRQVLPWPVVQQSLVVPGTDTRVVHIVTEEHFLEWNRRTGYAHADLPGTDPRPEHCFTCAPLATVRSLKEAIEQYYSIPQSQQRLWVFARRSNKTFRPATPLCNDAKTFHQLFMGLYTLPWLGFQIVTIFVERCSVLVPPSPESVLLFFKFFDPAALSLQYVGHALVPVHERVGMLVPSLLEMLPATFPRGTAAAAAATAAATMAAAGDADAATGVAAAAAPPFPVVNPVALYEEITPRMVDRLDPRTTLKKAELQHGDIIIFQLDPPAPSCWCPTPREFLAAIGSPDQMLLVSFLPANGCNLTSSRSSVTLALLSRMPCDAVVAKLSCVLGVDPATLRLSNAAGETLASATTPTLLEMVLDTQPAVVHYDVLPHGMPRAVASLGRVVDHSPSVVESLSTICGTDEMTDCTVVCQGATPGERTHLRAHAILLAHRSPVLRAALSGDFIEGRTRCVEIEADEQVARVFVGYLYHGVATLMMGNVVSLARLAQQYDLGGLYKECMQFLEQALNPTTACAVLVSAIAFGEAELQEKAYAIILESLPGILGSGAFDQLAESTVTEILRRVQAQGTKCTPTELFNGLHRWACANADGAAGSLAKQFAPFRPFIAFDALDEETLVRKGEQVLPHDEYVEALKASLLGRKKQPLAVNTAASPLPNPEGLGRQS